jgi:non-specific serine/threonine protein kinase
VTTVAAAGAPSARGQGGAALPVLDAPAKAAYRRRLGDLRHQLEEAEQFHDEGRAARARDEIAALTEQLAAAVDIGGRDRRVALDAERARSTVAHGIRMVLRKLRSRLPVLADDLALRIKTGTFCVYTPDPMRSTDWGPPDPE